MNQSFPVPNILELFVTLPELIPEVPEVELGKFLCIFHPFR